MSDRVLLGVADARDLHIPWHRKYLSVLVMFALQNKPAAWEAFARATRPAWSAAVADKIGAAATTKDALRTVLDIAEALEPGTTVEIDVDTHQAVAADRAHWGPLVWYVFHHLCFFHRDAGARAVAAAAELLPCEACRADFKEHLERHPFDAAKESAFAWSARLHNAVSVGIGKYAVPVAAEERDFGARHLPL